jgi:hypothetical protein
MLLTIILKPGPARQTDLRLEPSLVEKKNRGRKKLVWPGRPGKTRLKTRLQPVYFFFFTKMTLF